MYYIVYLLMISIAFCISFCSCTTQPVETEHINKPKTYVRITCSEGVFYKESHLNFSIDFSKNSNDPSERILTVYEGETVVFSQPVKRSDTPILIQSNAAEYKQTTSVILK